MLLPNHLATALFFIILQKENDEPHQKYHYPRQAQ